MSNAATPLLSNAKKTTKRLRADSALLVSRRMHHNKGRVHWQNLLAMVGAIPPALYILWYHHGIGS